ncbi:GNAT family N-acetyltransferase [uncultured Ferrimonas sp.]|uniref:GNAT family N-acetyltransferase n=1 Tax=uncultured Ferrimonas sp. TaxID=432640 RepID=UPI00260BEEF5|nr:GNAT family N-acetyltransferase [uncultured Ferrimonas sp.]
MNHVTVSAIQIDDIEPLHAALSAVISERKFMQTLEPPPLKNISDFVRLNIEQQHAQFVAYVDNRLIGWCDIVPHTPPSQAHIGYMGMGIIQGYRGQGIGQRLLQRAIEHAFSRGLTRLELEVFANNHAAIAMYQKLGFEIEGRKRFGRKIDQNYLDILLMARYHPSII